MITISNVQYSNFNNKILSLEQKIKSLSKENQILLQQNEDLLEQNKNLASKIKEYEAILPKEENNDYNQQSAIPQS